MPTVLVTGASSGIGHATAARLAEGDFEVFAAVRADADRAAVERRLPGVKAVQLDVTDAGSIARCVAEMGETLGERGLDGLVNNAGAPFPGPLEVLPLDDFRAQLEVNLTGQLAVTQAFLPALRRSEGRIVFVSSLGGRVALPFAGAYHASKFGLEAVGESLRQELRGSGVRVCLIEPGVADSEIWGKAADRSGRLAGTLEGEAAEHYAEELRAFERRLADAPERAMDADAVAKAIEGALTSSRPRFRVPVGLQAKLLARARPLLPNALFDFASTRLLRGS
jgi:NAD(P)-dependent dehydrogenase (short-subunit alcohol dehydrogenase family)